MDIYKITNLINDKIYIGLEKNYDPEYYGSGRIIRLAVSKYGKENFKKEILQHCNSKDELCEAEKYWINYYNSFPPNGYNITPGGEWGDTFTHNPNKEEIRKKYISKLIGNKYTLGHKYSDEIKRKWSLQRIGHKTSEETKIKIRLSNLGKKRSSETCINISKALKGKMKPIRTEEHKRNNGLSKRLYHIKQKINSCQIMRPRKYTLMKYFTPNEKARMFLCAILNK